MTAASGPPLGRSKQQRRAVAPSTSRVAGTRECTQFAPPDVAIRWAPRRPIRAWEPGDTQGDTNVRAPCMTSRRAARAPNPDWATRGIIPRCPLSAESARLQALIMPGARTPDTRIMILGCALFSRNRFVSRRGGGGHERGHNRRLGADARTDEAFAPVNRAWMLSARVTSARDASADGMPPATRDQPTVERIGHGARDQQRDFEAAPRTAVAEAGGQGARHKR